MKNNRRKFLEFFLSVLILALVLIGVLYFTKPQAASNSFLKAYFLNVGQGDAEYIKNPDGTDILIDGGPDNSVLTELGKVMDFSDREINLVVLTHPHADHLTGLIEVINRYQVDEIWETGVEYPSSTYDSWKALITQKKISNNFVQKGEIKNFSGVNFQVIYPLSSLENTKIDNLNNASIVSRLDYDQFSVLFSGDAETSVQDSIVGDLPTDGIFADVLKVAHHGSKNGLSESFLKVVRPAIAVIEVGKDNKFGHPSPSTIDLLKKYAVRIYRTDQNGTIEIDSDGKNYWVK